MTPKLEKTFEFEGKNYEIYSFKDFERTDVAVFVDGKRANGYSYGGRNTVLWDLLKGQGYDAIPEFIELAEADVRDKTWERYCEAVKQVRKEKS